MKEKKTICNYICDLAEEEAIRSSDTKKFTDAKWLLKNVESILKAHFITITSDNRVIFNTEFDDVEKEILYQFIAEK